MTARATADMETPVSRHMQVEDSEFAAVSEGRIRIRIGAFIFMFALLIAVIRLGEVSLLTPKTIGHLRAPDQAMTRADIVDRNGQVLATTLATYALYARPRYIWDTEETAQELAALFPSLEVDALRSRKIRQHHRSAPVVENGL